MQFMILLTANAMSESGALPSEELLTAMGAYNEELVKAGVMIGGGGLTATKEGARVQFSGKDRSVTHGPFPTTERVLAGYWIFQTKSLEEAVEWVKKCPNPTGDTAEIEIRRLHETEDFAESDPTGELRRKEHELAEQIKARA